VKPFELFEAIADTAGRADAPLRLPSAVPPYRGTWAGLCEFAEDTAQWLGDNGIGGGDVVAVIGEPDLATLATILGAWRLNAAVTVLATARGAKRSAANYGDWLLARLNQVNAKLLVSGDKAVTWDELPVPSPVGARAFRNPADPAPLTEPAAVLQLTSGSTGDPKIVPVTASAIMANVSATAVRLGLRYEDSVVSWLPLNHDMGLLGTFLLPALTGLPLQLSTPDTFVRGPLAWLSDISQLRATLTFAPHFAYGLVARYGQIRRPSRELDLSHVRHFVNGSEPINGEEFAAFGAFAEGYGMPPTALRPGYGMAEVGLVLTMLEPGESLRSVTVDSADLVAGGRIAPCEDGVSILSCGRPLTGYEVTARSSDGEILDDGAVGELCVRGPSLFPCYLGTDRDQHFWSDGAYRTGDLGFLDGGEVFVCGRLKDVIIVRGENLVPQEIERKVAEVDGVRMGNVAAIGVRTPGGAEGVVVIAETTGRQAEPGALKARVAREVRDWFGLRPLDVILLPQGKLPKTTSGKLQRQLCRQTYLSGEWSR
jgi:fatty-acyl-CoA synthase